MEFFTSAEFLAKYASYASYTIENWQIEAVSQMIYSIIGLRYRDNSWTSTSAPTTIKNASMEQLRFMLESDIPFVDYNKNIKAGSMSADINTDYSTLALRMLGNDTTNWLYRGSRMTDNMALGITFDS